MDALNLPGEFRREIEALLGTQAREFFAAYARPHWRALRLNPRRGLDGAPQRAPEFALGGAPDWSAARALAGEYIVRPVPWQPGAHYIPEGAAPGASLKHLMGLYYIQEPSAMAAGAALNVQPGMSVLDLCAAPGGKSSQLAAALCGEGLLVANEPAPARARMLAGNLERQGFTNAVVTCEYPEQLAARWGERFDAILVDAPCSGEGMFRRDEGALREWNPDAPRACHLRQLAILDSAHRLLRPGGALVYSTCTFNRRENEDTIDEFLKAHGDMAPEDFELNGLGASRDGMMRLWPHIIDGEGHFVCRMRRAGVAKGGARAPSRAARRASGASARRAEAERALERLRAELALPQLEGEVELAGARLVLLPRGCPPLDGLRVERAGLELAEVGRSHAAPAYALCRALAPGARDVAVDAAGAIALVRAGSLAIEAPRGWVTLSWRGLPVCPGKSLGDMVKGHYPRGLKPLGTIAEECR